MIWAFLSRPAEAPNWFLVFMPKNSDWVSLNFSLGARKGKFLRRKIIKVWEASAGRRRKSLRKTFGCIFNKKLAFWCCVIFCCVIYFIFAMEKFKVVGSNIALLEIDNIDTDMIIPKQFLKTLKKSGLGASLFFEMRYREDGSKVEDFVLHKKEFENSQILLAGSNFGCGSSREHAPWAIKDFGIRVIIANSFADIFYGNCFKNGILPIVLSPQETDAIKKHIKQENDFTINLERQIIEAKSENFVIKFEIDAKKKEILLEGLDDIESTMKHSNLIDKFEEMDKIKRPWIYGN